MTFRGDHVSIGRAWAGQVLAQRPRRQEGQILKRVQSQNQKAGVAGNEGVGPAGEGRLDELVVVKIAAGVDGAEDRHRLADAHQIGHEALAHRLTGIAIKLGPREARAQLVQRR